MKILKVIEVYKRDKINPLKTYNIEFVKEFDISIIDINELKNIIVPLDNDDNLYLSYSLGKSQIIEIEKLSKLNFDVDYENYVYLFCQVKV